VKRDRDHPAIAWRTALLSRNGLPSTARLVGVAMAEHVNKDTGELWPGAFGLAERTGLNERSVRRQIEALERNGWLLRLQQGGRAGGPRTSRWRIATPDVASDVGKASPDSLSEVTPDSVSDVAEPTPDSVSLTPDNDDTDPGLSAHRTRDEPERTRKNYSAERADEPTPRSVAKAILDQWWKQQEPRPQQPYPAVLKVLEKALHDGWTQEELERALAEVPVISGGALDYWRRSRRAKKPEPRDSGEITEASAARLRQALGAAL
jgi:hypothetical protein